MILPPQYPQYRKPALTRCRQSGLAHGFGFGGAAFGAGAGRVRVGFGGGLGRAWGCGSRGDGGAVRVPLARMSG